MRDTLDHTIEELERRRAARVRPADEAVAERAAFLARFPFERFLADVERRATQEAAIERAVEASHDTADRDGFLRRLLAGLRALLTDRPFVGAAAAAAMVVAVGSVWMTQRVTNDEAGTTRVAGAPAGIQYKGGRDPSAIMGAFVHEEPVGVRFFVRQGEGAVPGEAGGTYREGDQVRFTYWSGDNDYLVLLSLEESGKVSVYYPDEEGASHAERSVQIVRGRNIPLDGSIVLNDYVGRERFFALFSPMPLSVQHVRNAATAAHAAARMFGGDLRHLDKLPLEVQQASFWIQKR